MQRDYSTAKAKEMSISFRRWIQFSLTPIAHRSTLAVLGSAANDYAYEQEQAT